MKLIATYIHEDHTTTRDHGEYIAHRAYEERGRKRYAFEFEGYEVDWGEPIVASIAHVGDETHIVLDWTK